MRVGLYLGRHSGDGSGIGVYARSLLLELVELAGEIENAELEIVAYGDSAVLKHEILAEISIADVLATVLHVSPLRSANSYFRRLPNGARCRVLIRTLPESLGRKIDTLTDGVTMRYFAWLDDLQILHAVANCGFSFDRPSQVITVHDLFQAWPPAESSKRKTSFTRSYYRRLFRKQFKAASRVIVDNPEVTDQIVEKYRFDRGAINCVPLGIDYVFAQFLESAREGVLLPLLKKWLEDNNLKPGYTLLFASSDPRKNLDYLLEGWIEFARDCPETQLVISGVGPTVRYRVLKKIKQKKLDFEPHISFVGRLDRSELPYLVLSAGGLLNATLAEGFGLPNAEALFLKTPVVASGLEFMAQSLVKSQEYLGELQKQVIVCDPTDVDSISLAIRALQTSELMIGSEFAALERKLERALLSSQLWRKMRDVSKETLAVYAQVLLQRGNP